MSDVVITAEQEALYNHLKYVEPRTKDELWTYVKVYFGVAVPRVAVAPGMRAPMDFLWDAFSEKHTKMVVIGGRGGMKTYLLAILIILFAVFRPGIRIGLMAAQANQLEEAYQAIKKFLLRSYEELIAGDPMQKRTTLINGSEIGLYMATERGSNSAHPHKLFIDELDQIKTREIYQEMVGMKAPDDKEHRLIGQTFCFSSWKKGNWIVSDEVKGLPASQIYKWSFAEVIQKCDRSSCAYCRTIQNQDVKSPINFYDACQGMLKNADGFWGLTEYQQKYFEQTTNTLWKSQYCSVTPDTEDSVFEMDDSMLDRTLAYDPNYPYFVGYDFGQGRDPNHGVLFQIIMGQLRVFDEIVIVTPDFPNMGKQTFQRCMISAYNHKPVLIGADKSSPAGKTELGKAFGNGTFTCSPAANYIPIDQGILLLKHYFINNSFKINPRTCPTLLDQLREYKYEGQTYSKTYNHGVDALRYGVAAVWSSKYKRLVA